MKNTQASISQRYKLLNPCRNQVEMQMKCLDDLLPLEHRARCVWEFVEKMDVNSCFEEILSYKDGAGRPTTTPKVLLSLWIYSILDGNISARKIEELCRYHDAYKWIAGGTPINRTMISEFRSSNPEKFEELLTSCLAVMLQSNLISDVDFSQDGTRVKANAGFNTFRKEGTLKNLQEEMKIYMDDLHNEFKKNPTLYDDRIKASKKTAATQRSQQIDDALKNLYENRNQKIENGKKKDNFQHKKNLMMSEPQ